MSTLTAILVSLSWAATLGLVILSLRRRDPGQQWLAAWVAFLAGLAGRRWVGEPVPELVFGAAAALNLLFSALLLYGAANLVSRRLPRQLFGVVVGSAAALPILALVLPRTVFLSFHIGVSVAFELSACWVLLFHGRQWLDRCTGVLQGAFAVVHAISMTASLVAMQDLPDRSRFIFVALLLGIGQALALGARRQRLETWRERLQLMLGKSSDWAIWCAPNGRLEYVNPAMAKTADLDVNTLQERNIFEWLGSHDAARIEQQLQEPDEVTPFRGELSLAGQGGPEHPVPVAGVLIVEREGHGALSGFGLSLRDLSERVEAQRQTLRRYDAESLVSSLSTDILRRSWNELGEGIDEALAAIGSFAQADRTAVLLLTPDRTAVANRYEWRAEEAQDLPVLDGALLPRMTWMWSQFRHGSAAWIPDLSLDRPDLPEDHRFLRQRGLQSFLALPLRRGQHLGIVVVSWFGRRAPLGDDEVAALSVIADVLTYAVMVKGAGERLAERESELMQAQKMEAIGELAGGLAHDFNNLLTVISSCSESLRDRLSSEPEAAEDLDQIDSAAERASDLTGQLLALGRRQELLPRPFDLNDRIRGLDRILRRLVGGHVELVVELEEALPPVHADPSQIEQVVLNLVVNARDAIERQGRIVVTTESRSASPRWVYLSVRDDGCGIDPDIQSRVFDPFFSTKEGGSGLGLSVVHGIVYQSGGSIEVESQRSQGTCFRVRLPRATGALEGARERAPAGVSREVTPARVLVVEDEEMVRMLTARALAQAGYAVTTACDGQEGVDQVCSAQEPFDVIVTDIVMPRLSGPEMIERLPVSHRDVPVLFISGYPSSTLGAGAPEWPRGVGRRTFLEKPFRPSTLCERVATLVDEATVTEGRAH